MSCARLRSRHSTTPRARDRAPPAPRETGVKPAARPSRRPPWAKRRARGLRSGHRTDTPSPQKVFASDGPPIVRNLLALRRSTAEEMTMESTYPQVHDRFAQTASSEREFLGT